MKSKNNQNQINFTKLIRVLADNKFLFITAFIIVFIIGLIITLITPFYYGLDFNIKLLENPDDHDFLIEYFPQEAASLWLYQDPDDANGEYRILENIKAEINNEEFLDELKESLSFDISIEALKEAIYASNTDELVSVKILYDNKSKTLEIADNLLKLIKSKKQDGLELSVNQLIKKIDDEISIISDELDNGDKKESDGLKEVDHELLKENLILTKQSLVSNKDDYINRIKVSEKFNVSDVYLYNQRIKNIFISVGWAILFGVIVSYGKYFYECLKN